MFAAMKYSNGVLSMIDQRELPIVEKWLEAADLETVAKAIEDMVVRGAPAIGCAAAWGLAIDVMLAEKSGRHSSKAAYLSRFMESYERLARTRPTAVNLFYALDKMKQCFDALNANASISDVKAALVQKAQDLETDDLKTCKAIGDHGAGMFSQPINVLTHCNTGSLATAGYGTALGIVRSLANRGLVKEVFVDETRPYLQGARLTAFELVQEKIPHRLICDNMAAYAMQHGWVDLVVVGADRIARNGDTANKIGTYGLAVLCKHHNIPFVVAAPTATIDTKIDSGAQIPVEQRPPQELREVQGKQVAPVESPVWNPSFDVTPASLITAVVTEHGVFKGPYAFSI